MKFTLNPLPGEAGFLQWKDAMKALVRLPGGVPKEFRKSIWLNLSKQYIIDLSLDWNKIRRAAFNDRSNPDDDELGIQIVKDLHRTGCSAFSGHENEQDRALLKRVLLAFARYNKSVGYCQGFNIIAALILEIVDKKEEDALMCMIYLIDHILPEGYFTNSMHTLAIDMAVFRELLKLKLPKLYQHLNELQFSSFSPTISKKSTSTFHNTYEPPLTNVFTMQWFLTLFATCLSKNVLLRVWDCVFLEGSEILFRTSIAIWDKLSVSVMKANSADSFYSMMSILSVRLFDQNVIEANDLINRIYSFGSFPLIGLEELREKFTFNITPFQLSSQNGKKSNNDYRKTSEDIIDICDENKNKNKINNTDIYLELSRSVKKKSPEFEGDEDIDDFEVEDLAKMISCFALLMPNRQVQSSSTSRKDIMMTAVAAANALGMNKINKHSSDLLNKINKSNDENRTDLELNRVTPGSISFITQMYDPKPLSEQLTLDLNELKKQYKKLKERQKQAHIIIQTASDQHRLKQASSVSATSVQTGIKKQTLMNQIPQSPFCLETAPIVNHLLMKANDPKRNTLKTTIQLSTNRTISDSMIEKINQSKSMIEHILQVDGKSNKIEKNQKPYFSDDEDDDEEEDEETEIDLITMDQIKKMSLIDLANLGSNSNQSEAVTKSNSSSSSSSSTSTSSLSSPIVQINKKIISAANSKQFATSVLIDHLVKEESRHKTPVNPFPIRHINSNVAKNGLRLGLYK